MTDGRLVLPMAAATSKTDFLLVSANPTGAVAISMLHSCMKFLRETPLAFRCSAMVGCLDICAFLRYGITQCQWAWHNLLRSDVFFPWSRGAVGRAEGKAKGYALIEV